MYAEHSLPHDECFPAGIAPIHCVGVFTGKKYTVSEWIDGIEECTLRFPDGIDWRDERDIRERRHRQCDLCRGCPEKLKLGVSINTKKMFRKVWDRQKRMVKYKVGD